MSNIKVMCRFRPLNHKEPRDLCADFDDQTVHVGQQQFNFDKVFTPAASQGEVYNDCALPIVEAVMEGFNGTVLAYGQTSSGKTYTMTGAGESEGRGILPRMISTLFALIENTEQHIEFSVKVSYAEIYLEKIRDLLDPSRQNLKIHENPSIYIEGLTETYVSSEGEVLDLMKQGTGNREVAYTQMNAGSSRSHAIFVVSVSQTNTLDYSGKTGKLYLVDLAGSEKIRKTGAEGRQT